MTGNTATVLVGLAIIVAVLPIGLLVLFRAERLLERNHPDRPPVAGPRLQVPALRPSTPATIPAQATPAAAETVSSEDAASSRPAP
jgi:hypothetical protein